ncbi:prepilin peptidase [Dietzia sp. NPDC055343]
MLFVIAAATGLVCAVAAAVLGRWMRGLADSDSRWLRIGLHVVLAGGGGFGAAYLARGWADLVTFAALSVACALLVTIDLAVFRLPDKIVLPMYPVVFGGLLLAAAVSNEWGSLGRAAAAAAALLAFYFILALINPSGMGLGDVKLSGLLGAFLGWLGWPAVMAGTLAAFVINAAVALVLLAARRVGAKSGIAFGPAMVIGAALGAAYFAVRSGGVASLGAA